MISRATTLDHGPLISPYFIKTLIMHMTNKSFWRRKLEILSYRNCVEGKSIANGIYPPTTDLPLCPLRIIKKVSHNNNENETNYFIFIVYSFLSSWLNSLWNLYLINQQKTSTNPLKHHTPDWHSLKSFFCATNT